MQNTDVPKNIIFDTLHKKPKIEQPKTRLTSGAPDDGHFLLH